jgi:hypothetical protein
MRNVCLLGFGSRSIFHFDLFSRTGFYEQGARHLVVNGGWVLYGHLG